jgi:hypothetical protein
MPFGGLIQDSALLYYASKGLRSARPKSRGRSRSSVGVSITVQNLIIYKPILNFELNNRYGMVGRDLHKKANLILQGAKLQVGVKSGHLRKSLHIEHVDASRGQSVRIGSNVSYALAHHEGTKPHLITPKAPNTVLRFRAGSAIVNTTLIRHPGTKANKYLSDQLRLHVR